MAIKKGGKVLTAREQKRAVMAWKGWTSEQYNKEYDKLRNRTRNYERAIGAEKGTINVADVLARDARNEYYHKTRGLERRIPAELSAIRKTTSASTGKELAQKTVEKVQKMAVESLSRDFGALLKTDEQGNIKSKVVAEKLAELPEDATIADRRAAIKEAGQIINEQRRSVDRANKNAPPEKKQAYPES